MSLPSTFAEATADKYGRGSDYRNFPAKDCRATIEISKMVIFPALWNSYSTYLIPRD